MPKSVSFRDMLQLSRSLNNLSFKRSYQYIQRKIEDQMKDWLDHKVQKDLQNIHSRHSCLLQDKTLLQDVRY